jgi:hypothetical protein
MNIQLNIIEDIVELRHIKVVTTETYTDGLKSVKKEYCQNIATGSSNVMYDMADCLDVIKNGISDEVTITIKADQYRQPKLITKSWKGEHVIY